MRRHTGPSTDVVVAVLERASYACEICGVDLLYGERGVDYSIHHRLARKMGGTRWDGSNLPSNLLVVCGHGTSGCHGEIESRRSSAVARGWLVLSHEDPEHVAVLITRDRWRYLAADGSYAENPVPA